MSVIHHTYGPHVDRNYVWKVLSLSYKPWAYVHGDAPEKLEHALFQTFRGEAVLFSSGRESLLALLRALEVRPGEEIIVQGYTCIVVPNAIQAAGALPIYADIDPETLNLTPETVKPLITSRTRAIVCQHTFGIPAEAQGLRSLCDAHKILLIEDLAHVLPDSKGPEQIGMYGDYLLLSFGRDKAISGISGGAVISRHRETTVTLRELQRTAIPHSWWHTALLLEYAPRMAWIVRPLAGKSLQRPILWLLKKLGLIVPVVTEDEKRGRMSPILHTIPNACAALALRSLHLLPRLNERRRTLASFLIQYGKKHNWPLPSGVSPSLPLQKLPMFVTNAERIRSVLRKQNMILEDGWTGCVICPEGTDAVTADYHAGSDPKAEEACHRILSLPTHPTMTLYQAQRLARAIDEQLKSSL